MAKKSKQAKLGNHVKKFNDSPEVELGGNSPSASVATAVPAQTSSWDDFLRTGCAEGEYTHVQDGFEKPLDDHGLPALALKLRSHYFAIGARSWNLHLFPTGSVCNRTQTPAFAVFLQLADSWYLQNFDTAEVAFTLTVVNRVNPDGSISKESHHTFTTGEDDWGFADFVKTSSLMTACDEFMPDGKLHIKVKVKVKLAEKYTAIVRHVSDNLGLRNPAAVATPPATAKEARSAMLAARAAGDAAQREVAVQAAKYKAAEARLAMLEAEAAWRAAQAVADSAMVVKQDGDGGGHQA